MPVTGRGNRRGMGARVDGVQRIAVLRANALGDLLLATPALDALKQAYPKARLTLLGLDWHAAFLTDRPGPVDEVIALPPISGVSTAEPGHTAPPGLMDGLRARRFDLAVQMHGGGRYSNPFIRGLGARVTAGLCTPDAERLDRWVPYLYLQHETLRMLEVAALVGAGADGAAHDETGDGTAGGGTLTGNGAAMPYPAATPRIPEPRIAVTERDRAELARVLGDPPPGLVAVHPGATDPRRRWPPRRFAAVAARLDRPVAVTGTEAERDLVEEVATALPDATPVVGVLGIGGLAALYERCDLVISNDTGPRHLAAAVGTPTVGVYWCGNLVNAGPLTRTLHRPVTSWTVTCPVCGVAGTDPRVARCEHNGSWVRDVAVEDVAEQAEDLLRHGAEENALSR
ncbi:ADP-heptose:LPS heptosyltransferase [Thermostaphylospora chromogena]|uniref:ADP-heptose:LPS heptosyltransferase n=2 Tax=Thermostaphylospora chromogena TaxID=35622 RepID=A0A1H1D9G4_9ACTN|nr:ADP-heptose:LPS heptosyltransferase [Thermostaphylospora chromogena]